MMKKSISISLIISIINIIFMGIGMSGNLSSKSKSIVLLIFFGVGFCVSAYLRYSYKMRKKKD